MDKPNYVKRAFALMKSQARTAALVIVPLAAAVSAHAGPAGLPTTGLACTYSVNSTSGTGNSCMSGAGVSTLSGAGINGLSFSLINPSSGSSGWYDLGTDGGAVMMGTRGVVGVAIPSGTTIPVSYDFEYDLINEVDPTWQLKYILKDFTTGQILGTAPFSGTFGTSGAGIFEFTGSGSLVTSNGSSATDIIGAAFLLVNGSTGGTYDVSVMIPGDTSIDLDSFTVSGVPEPASFGLLGAGLVALGMWRKRRK